MSDAKYYPILHLKSNCKMPIHTVHKLSIRLVQTVPLMKIARPTSNKNQLSCAKCNLKRYF